MTGFNSRFYAIIADSISDFEYKIMACNFGTEPKDINQGTITIDLYEGLSVAALPFLVAAAVPPTATFAVSGICATEPPEYQDIGLEDLLVPPILNEKIISNAKRKAWFLSCKCSPNPNPNTPPPPQPKAEPSPSPEPQYDTSPPNDYSAYCTIASDSNYLDVQYRGWTDDTRQNSFLEKTPIEVDNIDDLQHGYTQGGTAFFVTVGGTTYNFPSYGGYSGEIYDYRLAYCQSEYVDEPPTDDGKPVIDSFCCKGDWLNDVDKAEILGELKLWISQVGTRVQENILAQIIQSETDIINILGVRFLEIGKNFTAIDTNIATAQTLILNKIGTDTKVVDDNAALRADSIKNHTTISVTTASTAILAAIAAATAATASAITAATTATAAAITAATATVTSAIAATQSAIATAITAARQLIENKIESSQADIERKIEETIEDYTARYFCVYLSLPPISNSVAVTYGNNGAKDKYALGWLEFRYKTADGKQHSYERQYIIYRQQVFIAPEQNREFDYFVHLLYNMSYTATTAYTKQKP